VRNRKQLPLEALQQFLLTPPDPPQPLDGRVIFGNDHPLEVEVGCGKGAFLLHQALRYPQHNFLGIEIDRGLQLYVATRMAKRSLHHVRMIGSDAKAFLRDCLAPGCVSAVHVYFPDPWWKKRHRKRRVFTPDFAQECERVLQPDGKLHVATDVEEYFHEITNIVAAHTGFQPLTELPPWEVETNFERKAKQEQRAIWRISYRKQATQAAATADTAGFSTRIK
jgi:tRNA (guanine-N7-)-methyltransferase